MTKAAISCGSSKSTRQIILEYILFALCLSVIALRAMITEGTGTPTTATGEQLNSNIYSLAISAVLICSFVAWFITAFYSKRFSYRFSGLEIGLCLFIIAALIGIFVAANKRAVITHLTTLAAPILMAVLLVQLLDSHTKIKLLLVIVAALGVVHAYQSAEQYFVSNQMTIEQYEQNRDDVLKSLGIEDGTFAHFLF